MLSRETLGIARIATLAVPVAPIALGIAIQTVEAAELMRKEGQKLTGEEKLEYAVETARDALLDHGIKEKRIKALIELALLVIKDEASVSVED